MRIAATTQTIHVASIVAKLHRSVTPQLIPNVLLNIIGILGIQVMTFVRSSASSCGQRRALRTQVSGAYPHVSHIPYRLEDQRAFPLSMRHNYSCYRLRDHGSAPRFVNPLWTTDSVRTMLLFGLRDNPFHPPDSVSSRRPRAVNLNTLFAERKGTNERKEHYTLLLSTPPTGTYAQRRTSTRSVIPRYAGKNKSKRDDMLTVLDVS